ncbi:MAG TPA: hypothetical protein VK706_08945 [Candidatus Sulfotelmatobacter sp.]|jgi:hypothetical protein|nr:hypothetical protein [Candidatus Sulfotelmatobacter sp.]
MRKLIPVLSVVLVLAASLVAQTNRLWVLRPPGEVAEYDPATFAAKQTVKIPAEVVASPQSFSVNHLGQMLFAAPVSLPLTEEDLAAEQKIWFWDGHTATTLTREVARTTATAGSNLSITESAPVPYLSEDGTHLYWFSNQGRRLQRDGVDLSTKTTWLAWQTDLSGAARQDMPSVPLPDCPCPTGGCEETCPYGQVWVPDDGVGKFFLLTLFVSGKTQPIYQATSLYEENAGKWASTPINPPLRRVLDAANATTILEAIPDTACCGWQNQTNDQTLLHLHGKTLTLFDEQATYKNPDYDVSFYTQNGKLSPDLASVALTIVATAQPNKPIQLSEQGQANPEESQRIRKALLDLPAVEIKTIEVKSNVSSNDDTPHRIAFLPHATLVGWISPKEILIVEGHVLVAYNIASGARRKSNIHVEDAAHVFLR